MTPNSAPAAQQAETKAAEPAQVRGLPSVEDIKAKIAAIEANKELSDQLQDALLASSKNSLQSLQQIAAAQVNQVAFKKQAESAGARAEKIQRELKETQRSLKAIQGARDPFSLSGKTSEDIGQLEAARSALAAEVAALQAQVDQIESLPGQRESRRKEIDGRQATADADRAKLEAALQMPAPEGQSPLLTEAKALEAQLALKAFDEGQLADRFEAAAYRAEESVGLLKATAQREHAKLAMKQARLEALTERIRDLRQQEASSLTNRVREQAEALPEPQLFEKFAAENIEYAKKIQDSLDLVAHLEQETKQLQGQLDQQKAELAEIQHRIDLVGLTRPIGLLLRERYSDLLGPRGQTEHINSHAGMIETALQQTWTYERMLKQLPSARTLTAEVLPKSETLSNLSPNRREDLLATAKSLLETRRELLSRLQERSSDQFEALSEFHRVVVNLRQQTSRYLEYINERILWTRSAEPLSAAVLASDAETWRWLVNAENWLEVGQALIADSLAHPVRFWLPLIFVLGLCVARFRMKSGIRERGQQASQRGFLRYGPTAQAALLTLIRAATGPLVLAFFSWRLAAYGHPENFRAAVSASLAACAALLFPIQLLDEVCRHWGLAEAHFNWPAQAIAPLRHAMRWLTRIGIPIVFFAVLAHHRAPASGGLVPERLLFIAWVVLVAVVINRLLRTNGPLSMSLRSTFPRGAFTRFHRLWQMLGVGVPLVLAGLSAIGFHYSAAQVSGLLMWSIWLAATLLVLRSLAVRAVYVARRRLMLEQAKLQRAAAGDEEQETGALPKPPPEVAETDVAKSTAQTRRLISMAMWGMGLIGLWFIWNAVFPAVGNVLRTPIRATFTQQTEATATRPNVEQTPVAPQATPAPAAAAAGVGGEGSGNSGELIAPIEGITWLQLGGAILIALLTILATRDLPGLMEMSILRRLPVDSSTRYTATRLTSYAIMIVGVVLAAKSVGLAWHNVQWLAAALTVGLGFGLQEIFANFVSGLIVLFERPIRVGDTVTIDGTTGVVSRIRMRATTIMNWDRQEFIVPNKDLITGRLLNWTLSNSTARMALIVTLPAGNDSDRIRKLLLAAAAANPYVLDDPPPIALLNEFAEGRFIFKLLVYLDGLDYFYDVTHDLHTKIAQSLQEAEMTLGAPKQEIHIKTLPPEWTRLQNNQLSTSPAENSGTNMAREPSKGAGPG